MLQTHTSLVVKLVQSYSWLISSPSVDEPFCQRRKKHDSASYLEKVWLSWQCSGMDDWNVKILLQQQRNSNITDITTNKAGSEWQQSHKGWIHSRCCQLHTEARCYFRHHKHTAYNDGYLQLHPHCHWFFRKDDRRFTWRRVKSPSECMCIHALVFMCTVHTLQRLI